MTVGEKLIVPYKLAEVRLLSPPLPTFFIRLLRDNKHNESRRVNTDKFVYFSAH